jgi:transposase
MAVPSGCGWGSCPPLASARAVAAAHRAELHGLAAHRDYPMISLDNSTAEQALRRTVVIRKDAYGSRIDEAARPAARIWTVTTTSDMAGLNVPTYLTAYLDACGRNRGKPLAGPELERFLSWAADAEDLRGWAQPPLPG